MKTKILLSILFLASIGIGIGFASTLMNQDKALRAWPALALKDGGPLSQDMSQDHSLSIRSTEASSGKIVSNQDLSLAEKPKTEQVEPVEMLQALNGRALAALRPGWVHLHEEKHYFTEAENNGVLPNQVAIPNDQIIDTWFNIRADRRILQSVSIMRTMDGQIVQVGVFSNGRAWNSATNEVQTEEPFRLEGFDYNFLRELQRLQAFGAKVEMREQKTPDGGEGTLFIVRLLSGAPEKFDDFSRPVIASERRGLFSKESGYLIEEEVIFTFDDGSQQIYSRVTQEIKFEPPADEALNYLAQLEEKQ